MLRQTLTTLSAALLGCGILLSGCAATDEPESQSADELSAEQIAKINSAIPSEEQVRQNIELNIRQRASNSGFDVPDVEPRGFYTPEESWRLRGQCLGDYGYDVIDNPDGSRTVNFPEGQKNAYELAQLTCELMYPKHIRYSVPHTAEQRTIFYNYIIHDQIPCLEQLGYTIDHKRIPSLQVFAETYWTDKQYSPLDDIANALGENWTQQDSINVEVVCPIWPPTEVLWPNG